MSDDASDRARGDDVALGQMLLRSEGRREAFAEVIEALRVREQREARAGGLHPGLSAARRLVAGLEKEEREAQMEMRRRA